MNILKDFKLLKDNGLAAKNPDQSAAMLQDFKEVVDTCRWKGFSEEDIMTLFKTAVGSDVVSRNLRWWK